MKTLKKISLREVGMTCHVLTSEEMRSTIGGWDGTCVYHVLAYVGSAEGCGPTDMGDYLTDYASMYSDVNPYTAMTMGVSNTRVTDFASNYYDVQQLGSLSNNDIAADGTVMGIINTPEGAHAVVFTGVTEGGQISYYDPQNGIIDTTSGSGVISAYNLSCKPED